MSKIIVTLIIASFVFSACTNRTDREVPTFAETQLRVEKAQFIAEIRSQLKSTFENEEKNKEINQILDKMFEMSEDDFEDARVEISERLKK